MRTNDEILSDARMLYDLLSQAEELPGPAEMVLAMGGSDLGVADTAAEFAQKTLQYCKNAELSAKTGRDAMAFVKDTFGMEAVWEIVKEDFQ